MYKKIGVAVAFSPRCEAIIGKASRLQKLFGAVLVLIHVGETQPDEKSYLDEMIEITGVNREKLKIVWENGKPAKKIISVAKKEKIDLLVAGALQRENVVKFYFGSIDRGKTIDRICGNNGKFERITGKHAIIRNLRNLWRLIRTI